GRMSLRTAAIGVASVAWLLAVELSLSAQAPAPSAGSSARPQPVRPRPVTASGPARTPGPAVRPPAAYHPPTAAAFSAATKPLLNQTCGDCHNSTELAGGLDMALYSSPESLAADPERWERILAKLKSGEMPPPEVERPDAEIKTLVSFLEAEFARADASMRPDPGRVTARRLNRAEYTNTIRDLLAIDF